MSTGTEVRKSDEAPRHKPHEQALMPLRGPRLPFHPLVEERFNVDRASWKALVEAIFPNATSVESVVLALSYCKARKLDPFKRNVHIVPIWNKDAGGYVDTIWPGIGELRTTAFRTGEYAGRGETVLGPDVTRKVGSIEMTFPEWAQVTVYRMVKGQRVEFCGPRVYWLETYATIKRTDDTPNDMWRDRPRGQLEKCAEAAALRSAFPEEIGGDYIAEEVQNNRGGVVDAKSSKSLEELSARLEGPSPEAPAPKTEEGIDPPSTEGESSQEESADSLEPANPKFAAWAEQFSQCDSKLACNETATKLMAVANGDEELDEIVRLKNARLDWIDANRGERSNQKSLVS